MPYRVVVRLKVETQFNRAVVVEGRAVPAAMLRLAMFSVQLPLWTPGAPVVLRLPLAPFVRPPGTPRKAPQTLSLSTVGSAPGEPFANDTGASVEGIDFRQDGLTAELISTDEKNMELEFGGRNEARPVYRPAMVKAQDAMIKNVADSIQKAIK